MVATVSNGGPGGVTPLGTGFIADKSEASISDLCQVRKRSIKQVKEVGSVKVGMPMLKLDLKNHYTRASRKNSGNARAVVCEGLSERDSRDPDIDRFRTPDNVYYTCNGRLIKSGNELADEWEQMAENYRITDKNGNQKKLRSDAGIGFAMIIKPDKSIMAEPVDRQEAFFNDAVKVVYAICKKRGLVIDAIVIHVDEKTPHVHVYGHDPEYKLGRKLGLPFKAAMNRTEFPPAMRQLGWPVEDLIPDPDDQTEHGLSSEEYKAKQRAKDIEAKATQEAARTRQEATERLQAVQEQEAAQRALQGRLAARERVLDELQEQAEADRREAAAARQEAAAALQAAEADRRAAAAARQKWERLEGIAATVDNRVSKPRSRGRGRGHDVSDIDIEY